MAGGLGREVGPSIVRRMTEMRLTQQQLGYFETFGFLKFPGLLVDEVEEITRRFEKIWADHGGGHHGREHDRERRSALVPFIDQDEYLSALIDHPVIDGAAASILGDDYNYTSSDGNFYVGDTGWHSDNYGMSRYKPVKMALYLDPVGRETGCLRVIPGSHHFGDAFGDALHKGAPRSTEPHQEELWGITGAEVPSVALESQPGDLVVFNQALKHGSFGGGDRRRMFTINFQGRHREEHIGEIRKELEGMARYWHDRAYGKAMIETAGPERMKHLEQRLANDDHLPELVRKARLEMAEPSRGF